MKPLGWIASLNIGNKKIDAQHRYLFELYNRVLRVEGGHPDRRRLLTELLNYVDVHFAEEEDLMQAIDYPDLELHKERHRELTERVLRLRDAADSELLDLLQEWLFVHIMTEDHRIKTFMESKRSSRFDLSPQ